MYEGSLCVCCMSTEDLEALFGSGPEADAGSCSQRRDDYGSMLVLCLRLPLLESDGHDSICTTCIRKLKDCLEFKKQALRSICILSSVKIKELISPEEIQLLEPTKTEETPPIEAPNELELEPDPVEKYELEINNEEIKNVNESIQEIVAYETHTATSKDSERKPGRRRGRPRLYSQECMPYRVTSDELDCRECGASFPTNITLKVHYNSHFGREQCAQCGARFVTRASLRKHAASHAAGPFVCAEPGCRQEFRKLNTLLSHKRYKHSRASAAPYPCRECGASLPTLHARLEHLARSHHLDPRRHQCPHCDRRFRHAGERAKHVAVCHEVRLARCPDCGRHVRARSLPAHRRRHRAPATAPPAPAPARKAKRPAERRFGCRLCGATFTQKKNAAYHLAAHARRGQLPSGERRDLARLLLDRRALRGGRDHGLLSDEEEIVEDQQSDESVLTDEMVEVLSESSASGEYQERSGGGAVDREGPDLPEIRTDFGFTIPSDFDK